jgi:hypothetical protein
VSTGDEPQEDPGYDDPIRQVAAQDATIGTGLAV